MEWTHKEKRIDVIDLHKVVINQTIFLKSSKN